MAEEKDVNEANEETKKALLEASKLEDSSSEEEVKDEYDTLVGTNESKIPYSRFKEVNDAKNAAQRQIEALKAEMDIKVNEAVNMKMVEQLASKTTDPVDDYSFLDTPQENKEVTALKDQVNILSQQLQNVTEYTERNILNQEMKQLKSDFPAMNKEHVLSMKKLRPDLTLEECAKHSNDTFLKHAKEVFQGMVNKKKEDAEKNKVVGKEKFRSIKPEEKPKTLDDAEAMMMKFVGDEE